MTDRQCENIIEVFKAHGFKIDSYSNYSVKGQVAQLINAIKELIEDKIIPEREGS